MKVQIFFELLSNTRPFDIFSAYDVCLIPALAEGLGFGRDRAFFRAAGLYLIGVAKAIPDPLGRASKPSPLDNSRLHMLRTLVERWRTTGAWETFRQALLRASPNSTRPTQDRDDASLPTLRYSTSVPREQLAGLHQLR